jgi:hypothetical protein
MTGGIGNTLAPLALGGVGDLFSLTAAFFVSSALVAIGLVFIGWMWFRTSDGSDPIVVGAVDGQAYAQGGIKQ